RSHPRWASRLPWATCQRNSANQAPSCKLTFADISSPRASYRFRFIAALHKGIRIVQPQDLLYAKTHEWVNIAPGAGGKIATVGISHFAVEALTDLVYIELPEQGRQLKAGESFGEIESVKAVSDLYSPVSGEIVEVNHALANRLDTLHDDPYGAGWIV